MKSEDNKTTYYQSFNCEDGKANTFRLTEGNDCEKVKLRGIMGNSRSFLNGGLGTTCGFGEIIIKHMRSHMDYMSGRKPR